MICANCGAWLAAPDVQPADGLVHCDVCGQSSSYKFVPLLLINGPSGTGKTTIYRKLIGTLPDHVLVEADTLLMEGVDMSDDWRHFKNLWVRLAHHLAQNGRPVVVFGLNLLPSDEWAPELRFVGSAHYLALVCEDDELIARLRARPSWRASGSQEFLTQMLDYNAWLKTNAGQTEPPIELLDTTSLRIEDAAEAVSLWIRTRSADGTWTAGS